MPQSTIAGPTYIGKGSTIKVGAKIYAGTSIGEVCKVGGEVEESIMHSYSNKQHDGFLGHAYVGMWVNLGAGTSNSDLKNDYGIVRVEIGGETIDTGSMYVGATIGDHSKTGILTALNTGTIVGTGCNLYGAVLHDKFVPSFTWGEGGAYVEYRLEKFLRVARSVMARRKMELSTAEESMLREAFSLTADERKMAGVA
jgi:UDP-N-acetylglucosamine diphosphorylase/glucosamine-1-phosphate N-acetyltransferase